MAKTTDRFHEYARLGAAIRRAELVDEMRAIDKAFPELRFQKRTAALLKTTGSPALAEPTTAEGEPASRKRRKRRKLTAAEKKVISERMKKYWAARKRKEA
jgi:hypothetical protein